MSFKDLDDFFDSSLRLPIRGKTYVVPSPDAKTGLWVQEALTVAAQAKAGQDVDPNTLAALELDDDEEKDLFKRILGTAHAEMVADNLPWEWIKHAGTTALIWAAGNTEAAERFWNSGGDPKAQRGIQPQDHKRSAKSARRGSRGSSSSPKTVKGEVIPGPKS